MSQLELLIDEGADPDQITVTFRTEAGPPTVATVELARFGGDWSLEQIQIALNDRLNRQRAQELGRGLFDRLFEPGSPIRAQWDASVKAHPKAPLEIRITAEALRGYPWELLWDDQDRKHARVGGLIRRWAGRSEPSKSSAWPFRLLLVVGVDDSKLAADERIDAMNEVAFVRKALVHFGRTIDIQFLPLPSHDVLRTVLTDYQPHVLHFIGHGIFDLGKNRHAVVIEHGGGTWYWNTSEIKEDLALAECVPRLAFLNCCRSGAERASSLGLQQAFSELGVPVVVAMQADVRGDYAAKFSRAFYQQALGVVKPNDPVPSVAEAVREGRRQIGSEDDVDWAIPTLTFSDDMPVDHAVLARRGWPDDPHFRTCREFDEARVFAFDDVRVPEPEPGKMPDVLGPRRRAVHWCHPVKKRDQPNLLIVRGPAGSGRTRLLHWCMETWALADPAPRLRYLRVDRPRGKNTVQWLVRLRAGEVSAERPDADRFLKDGLPPGPFATFYDAVARATGLLQGPTAIDDRAARLDLIDRFQREVADDVSVAPFSQAFLAGLQEVGGPIVLVFDQLTTEAISPELFAGFRESFVRPVVSEPSNVRVVLAVSREDYGAFALAGLGAESVQMVDMSVDQSPSTLQDMAVEAMRYVDEDELRDLAKRYLKYRPANRVGAGRLFFCQALLESEPFSSFERMR